MLVSAILPKWPKPGIDCLLDSRHFENLDTNPLLLHTNYTKQFQYIDNLELEKVMLGYDQMV